MRVQARKDRVATPAPGARHDRDEDPGAKAAAELVGGVLGSRARSAGLLRLAALSHGSAAACAVEGEPAGDFGDELGALVHKVARHAYRVTDEDVVAARDAGWSEDELFEQIVATATGAGLARRELGRSAVARWEAGQ